MNETKPVWASKTVWFNGITLAAGVCTYLTTTDLIRQHPVVVASLIVANSVLNLILRCYTSKGVSLK